MRIAQLVGITRATIGVLVALGVVGALGCTGPASEAQAYVAAVEVSAPRQDDPEARSPSAPIPAPSASESSVQPSARPAPDRQPPQRRRAPSPPIAAPTELTLDPGTWRDPALPSWPKNCANRPSPMPCCDAMTPSCESCKRASSKEQARWEQVCGRK